MTVRTVFLLALSVVAMLGCAAKDTGDKEPPAVVIAQTVVVQPRTAKETLSAIGTVVPRAGHVATLGAPAQGRVEKVLVTTGQLVHRGQALIQLDQAPFRTALQAAQATFAAAQQANERQQRLSSEGIVAKKDAQAAAADMARALADVSTAERALQLSTLTSPINGIVTLMTASLGASVDPGVPLVDVVDPTALDVLLNVTPSDANRIRPGADVSLYGGLTAAGELLGTGTVTDVAGVVDTASRGVAVRVQTHSTDRPLRMGETIFGTIVIGTRLNAIVVPSEALVPQGEGFKVFVVDANGVAHSRDVTIGAKTEGGVEIASGLAAGDQIVTGGAYGVTDSATVRPSAPGSHATSAPTGDSATAAHTVSVKP